MEDVINFIKELQTIFPPLFEYLPNSIIIAFVSLGMVYLIGRMLNILKGDIPKNIVAIIFMGGVSYFLAYMKYGMLEYKFDENLMFFIWDIFLYFTVAVIIYVTVCFRLYDRIDSFLDKKFGEDKQSSPKKKKKVKK